MNRKHISQAQVDEEFLYVRKSFFPQWDRQGLWKVKIVAQLDDSLGECCRKSKTIRILNDVAPYTLRLVLIHEISHAIAAPSILLDDPHLGPWQERMHGAARRAERFGMTALVTEIRQDVIRYNDPEVLEYLRCDRWYADIREKVREHPEASFTEVCDMLSLRSIVNEQELHVPYDEAQAVYDQCRSVQAKPGRKT